MGVYEMSKFMSRRSNEPIVQFVRAGLWRTISRREDVQSLGPHFNLLLMTDGRGHEEVRESADISCCIHNPFWSVDFQALKSFELIPDCKKNADVCIELYT